MNEKELRRKAAELAWECRSLPRKALTIRENVQAIRVAVKVYMVNTRRFHRVHGTWTDDDGQAERYASHCTKYGMTMRIVDNEQK